MTEMFEKEESETGTANGTNASFGQAFNDTDGSMKTVLEYKLVMMNKQEDLGLGLGHVRRRKYGAPVPIKTVGNKGSVELRGPPAVPSPSPARVVAKGLKDVAVAGATALPAAAMVRLSKAGWSPDNKKRPAGTVGPDDTVRSMSRHSMTRDQVADVVRTEPGTMLVRLTSGGSLQTPAGGPDSRTRRRVSVRCGSHASSTQHRIPGETTPQPLADAEARAVLEAMQQLPETSSAARSSSSGGLDEHPDQLPVLVDSGDENFDASADAAIAATDASARGVEAGGASVPLAPNTQVLTKTRQRMMAPVEGQTLQEIELMAVSEAQSKSSSKNKSTFFHFL